MRSEYDAQTPFYDDRAVSTVRRELHAGIERYARADRARGWGSSHKRWVGPEGTLRRSFIRPFSERQLAREYADAGLYQVERVAGWHVLQLLEHLPNTR